MYGSKAAYTFTPDPMQNPMTLTLLQQLNKHVLYNVLAIQEQARVKITSMVPYLELHTPVKARMFSCNCCKWKGGEKKVKRYYLEVASITELEYYCPKCNHYLGFVSE